MYTQCYISGDIFQINPLTKKKKEEFPNTSKANFCTMKRATIVESCPIYYKCFFFKAKTCSVNNFVIQCIKMD